MSFHTKTITKELKTVPFDVAYQLFMDAADTAAQTLEAENTQRYEEYIQKLEQEYSDQHEAPYEGNFSDQVPYQPHPNLTIARNKAGQHALITEFIPRYKLETSMQSWIMPQIISWLTHKPIKLAEVVTTEGQIDGFKLAKQVFDYTSKWDLGLYQFLMLDSRSSWITSQYKGEGRQYCSLVPLIPYAFKLNHNWKYSQWDRDSLRFVVNDSLREAMLCKVPDMTRDEIIEARTQGLTFKTGVKKDTMRNPVSTFRLYDTTSTKLHGLPQLAQTMLAQIWCAHPSNRTKYMILDPNNWDSIPVPLISTDIFKPATAIAKPSKSLVGDDATALPWL